MLYDEDGWKTPKYTKDETKEKIPFGWTPIPTIYKVEANCFPVSENTKNKLDLP